MISVVDPQASGASGDMLIAALIDAGADPTIPKRIAETLTREGHPTHVRVERTRTEIGPALRLHVEDHPLDPEELPELLHTTLDTLNPPPTARRIAERALQLLLEAEKKVHREEEPHLHELATTDTILDITAAPTLLTDLNVQAAHVLPPATGTGTVRTEHGTLPVPAPATLEILKDWEVGYNPEGPGELLTPTGAALLRAIHEELPTPKPPYVPKRTGLGAGTKHLPDRPNVLRVILCEPTPNPETRVKIIETSIDDTDGETIGEALQRLMQLKPVKDVELIHGMGKKGRPRFILRVITKDEPGVEELTFKELFKWTGTLGARIYTCDRITAERKIIETEDGTRIKVSRFNDIRHAKPEWDDVKEHVDEETAPLTRARLLQRLEKETRDPS